MAENWKPIKLYVYLGSSTPPESTTRETVLQYLNGTDPDAIERAGRSYVEAAKLVQGDAGVQGAVMKAAASLASVWRGGDAAQALKALRLLHASAGALGQAMKQTGEPLTKYAGEVRRYRTMVAGLPTVTNPNPGLLNGGNNAGGTGVTDWTTPPLLNSGTGGGLNGTPLLAFSADKEARKRLEELNMKIYELNSQIAEGLAFQMPNITPLEVDTKKADDLDPGSGTKVPRGTTAYWSGDGTSGGPGGSDQSGSYDSDRPGDDTQGPGDRPGGDDENKPGQDQDKDQDGRDPGGSDDPNSPEQPGDNGTKQPEQQQPSTQDQDGDRREVPAVIGGEDRRTELADASPTTTPTTTANPNSTHMPTTAYTPTTQVPVNTANPFSTPGGPNGATWYGSGGPGGGVGPAVLRGGAASPGGGFMGYPPGGMGGATPNEGDENDRKFYDPEGDVFTSSERTSPGKIG
ncbi:hypothetical protein [Nonomuraea glycinis]|uniref:hypothetical protein n=1 Tax=Nonomuraea glycinis TaxID=2047744 RepID=UPI002E12CE91|nr:hypothetical protein OHA68_19950 [Nonomuraea glycinis]